MSSSPGRFFRHLVCVAVESVRRGSTSSAFGGALFVPKGWISAMHNTEGNITGPHNFFQKLRRVVLLPQKSDWDILLTRFACVAAEAVPAATSCKHHVRPSDHSRRFVAAAKRKNPGTPTNTARSAQGAHTAQFVCAQHSLVCTCTQHGSIASLKMSRGSAFVGCKVCWQRVCWLQSWLMLCSPFHLLSSFYHSSTASLQGLCQ